MSYVKEISAKEQQQSPAFYDLMVKIMPKKFKKASVKKKKSSTKAMSHKKFLASKNRALVQSEIINFFTVKKQATRPECAEALNIAESTISGIINPLLGNVFSVIGKVKNPRTNVLVELLKLNEVCNG